MDIIWPHFTYITLGIVAVLGFALFIYLGTLLYGAREKANENRLISIWLFVEAFGILCFFVPFATPSIPWAIKIGQLMHKISWVFLMISPLLILAYTGFLPTTIGQFFNTTKRKAIFVITGSVIAIFLVVAYWDVIAIIEFSKWHNRVIFKQSTAFRIGTLIEILLLNILAIHCINRTIRKRNISTTLHLKSKIFLHAFAIRYVSIFVAISMFLILWLGVYKNDDFLPQGITGIALILYVFGNILFGIIFAYAVISHQVYGIDTLFKKVLNSTAIGGAFVSVFFLVVELLQNYLSSEYGYIGGMSITVFMIFGRVQLMKIIEKASQYLLPKGDFGNSNMRIYRDQFLAAIEDGVITKTERKMLGISAKALNLSSKDCTSIERKVRGNWVEH